MELKIKSYSLGLFTAAFITLTLSILGCATMINPETDHEGNNETIFSRESGPLPLMTAVDIKDNQLIIINTATDQLVQIPLDSIAGWPSKAGNPQHTLIGADGGELYVTTDTSETAPAYLVALRLKTIEWSKNRANIHLTSVIKLESAGNVSSFPAISQVNPDQPIAAWTQPPFTLTHAPSILPYSDYIYFTNWTNDKVRVVNRKSQRLARQADPVIVDGVTNQTHGVNFNSSGTLGLGTGYYYDDNMIDLYATNKKTGELKHIKSIVLGDDNAYAAFTHYTYWLNERQAVTATMQFSPTSLTPKGSSIIGPSVWLIDAWQGTAEQIIGPVTAPDASGILRSASDVVIAAGKLYIAEEDSLDSTFADDGYISVFNISDIRNPVFIKRLRPGIELPKDFKISHGLNVTPDERYIYTTSYASNYIIKIDTLTDEVAHVFGPDHGLNVPHGSFIAGRNR